MAIIRDVVNSEIRVIFISTQCDSWKGTQSTMEGRIIAVLDKAEDRRTVLHFGRVSRSCSSSARAC